MTDGEIAALSEQGWFSREGFRGAREAAAAARQRVDQHAFRPAGISRNHLPDLSVRGDSTLWLQHGEAGFEGLVEAFESLRLELVRDTWLGLTRFDLQLAHYPGQGERYLRHRDAFSGQPGRRLTAIVYLNPDWKPVDGGELRLHATPSVELAPVLGRLVVFLSERLEHEVLPTWAPRLAATAWYMA